jgi:putative ABC transport system substrate-binding protein
MFNPDTAVSSFMPSLETAARTLKVMPIIAPVHSDAEIEAAVRDIGRESGGGLVSHPDLFMGAHRALVISAAARNNIPAVYPNAIFARGGGLLSYGPDQLDNFRRTATYVDHILRGEKPGDLPVQLPTKFKMVVNRKTGGGVASRRARAAGRDASDWIFRVWQARANSKSFGRIPQRLERNRLRRRPKRSA